MIIDYRKQIEDYTCDKYYAVIYRMYGREREANGFMIHYEGNSLVLLSDKGLYQIRYANIIHMEPIKPHPNRWSKEFQELVLNNPYLNSVVNSEIAKNSDSSDSKERYKSDAEKEMEKTINEYADKFFGKAREGRN